MTHAASIVRWVARILGVLLNLLIIAFVIGEGVPQPSALTPAEVMMFAALALMMLGLIAAWKWEIAGAAVTLTGFALFWITDLSFPPAFLGIFPLLAFLHLLAAWGKPLAQRGS